MLSHSLRPSARRITKLKRSMSNEAVVLVSHVVAHNALLAHLACNPIQSVECGQCVIVLGGQCQYFIMLSGQGQ